MVERCRLEDIEEIVKLPQEIYADFIGSQLVKLDFDGGEVELNNGCLAQRGCWAVRPTL